MPIDAVLLAQLIDSHGAVLRLWVRRRCSSSEDVVQEAFCRLAAQEPPPDNPVAWLFRVCRNLAEKPRSSEERRRARERTWSARREHPPDPADPLEIAETMEAVTQLEDDLREVLVARLWGQLSLEEVARLCGISTATAFRRYEAALRELRPSWEPQVRSDHE